MDKELLFKPTLAEEDVVLPRGVTVRVRALTRDEVISIREQHTDEDGTVDAASSDNGYLALAMVDPVLTEDEVVRWAEASSAGEIAMAVEVVQRLSNLDDASFPGRVPGNRQQRRAAVRNGSRRKTR